MTQAARMVGSLFAAASALVLVAALAVTQAIAAGAPQQLRVLFRMLCHGMEARCFHWGGVPMPICARCTGLYLGFLIGIGLFAAVRKLQRISIPSSMVIVLVAPLVVDGITQAMGLRVSTNELRVATGLLCGSAALAWVMNRIELAAAAASSHQGSALTEP
jgi:uncharacterized membrane protein